ncbi:MAG: hypothetical protein K9K67_11860 [Bacteriovoracaceae bacterium]|nr:hypothetical protein [Bacteriovoracaceae bacterium]
MKALSLSILIGLISLTASASVGSSDPSDLNQYRNPKYTILSKGTLNEGIPNKGVFTKYGTVYTNLTNVCQEGNTIKTVQPVRVCSKWGYKLKTCKNGPNEGQKKCFDRDERECKAYSKVHGSSAITAPKKTCARISDKESREWRMKYSHTDKKFKTDFPNCSVFKTFMATIVTNYDFLIISNRGYASEADERRYGGALVDEVDYTIPACSAL